MFAKGTAGKQTDLTPGNERENLLRYGQLDERGPKGSPESIQTILEELE